MLNVSTRGFGNFNGPDLLLIAIRGHFLGGISTCMSQQVNIIDALITIR